MVKMQEKFGYIHKCKFFGWRVIVYPLSIKEVMSTSSIDYHCALSVGKRSKMFWSPTKKRAIKKFDKMGLGEKEKW